MSDIRIIKIIVNVNTAFAPILPYFERETFHEPKCKWVLDHFFKNFVETREGQSQREGKSAMHVAGDYGCIHPSIRWTDKPSPSCFCKAVI